METTSIHALHNLSRTHRICLENQNFYIIQHGIRMGGMHAWKQVLSEQEVWQTTAFLSHMDRLPSQVSDAWRSRAGGAAEMDSPSGASKTDKSMDMPMRR